MGGKSQSCASRWASATWIGLMAFKRILQDPERVRTVLGEHSCSLFSSALWWVEILFFSSQASLWHILIELWKDGTVSKRAILGANMIKGHNDCQKRKEVGEMETQYCKSLTFVKCPFGFRYCNHSGLRLSNRGRTSVFYVIKQDFRWL